MYAYNVLKALNYFSQTYAVQANSSSLHPCQDLDSFLTWLVQTQTSAASDQLPNDLEEAERLINKHAALKEEIGQWVTEGQQKAFSICNTILLKGPYKLMRKIIDQVSVIVRAGMKRTTSVCRP